MLRDLLHHRFGTLCRSGCLVFAFCLAAIIAWPQTQHSITVAIPSYTQGTDATTGFNFYRATVSGGPYTKMTATPIPLGAGSPVAQFVDTTGVGGTKYFYVATAVDAVGSESAVSNETSATFFSNPQVPQGVTAVAK
jgi:hypothetical protein